MTIRFSVLTLSDRSWSGSREDRSGPLLKERLESRLPGICVESFILPDNREILRKTLLSLCDEQKCDLIATTGGTGIAKRDVTPEATRDVIDREIPGMSEAMRFIGLQKTPHAMLSRGVCGTRGKTLIVNLPGSPNAIVEQLDVLIPAIRHAIALLAGEKEACDEASKASPS